ncbi:TetR/AcrR family transcriptional regulator [Amycolatopsis jejuensis]|uniref:TetR/AcrR family transcriptional regulator n=1 Tax=Amycolatopsis jejuensis TaxID=330084 RepID=UPI000527DCDD|nr:TetR/AcrR family transcriptional regulator [Amycolatopsis jejuensis]
MGKPRYHHGDLRTALLDAALVLVRERGVDGWSLREASARVGVAPSAAYHHFASREVLVGALSQQVLASLGERLKLAGGRARGRGGFPRVVAYGRAYVTWALEDPAIARLAFRARHTDWAGGPHPHDVLTEELDRLVRAGSLPAAAREGAEFVVWSAIHGLAVLLLDGLAETDGGPALAAQVERVVVAVMTGLAAEGREVARPVVHSPHTRRLEPQ